jgi:hypothetical protein
MCCRFSVGEPVCWTLPVDGGLGLCRHGSHFHRRDVGAILPGGFHGDVLGANAGTNRALDGALGVGHLPVSVNAGDDAGTIP